MSRPATGGDPARALDDVQRADAEGGARWAGAGGSVRDTQQRRDEQERWWQDQRPPHWE